MPALGQYPSISSNRSCHIHSLLSMSSYTTMFTSQSCLQT